MEPVDPFLIRKNRANTGRIKGPAASSPGHLGNALPGTDAAAKGLPEAEQSEPLGAVYGSGSHLAGDQGSDTPPGSQPSRRGKLLNWVFAWVLPLGFYWLTLASALVGTSHLPVSNEARATLNSLVLTVVVILTVKVHGYVKKVQK